MERILNKFGCYNRSKPKRQYKKIEYKASGALGVNSQRLIDLTVEGNELARNKGEGDYRLIGMFFTIVLIIEHKMISLLAIIDKLIESRMFVEKNRCFQRFLETI